MPFSHKTGTTDSGVSVHIGAKGHLPLCKRCLSRPISSGVGRWVETRRRLKLTPRAPCGHRDGTCLPSIHSVGAPLLAEPASAQRYVPTTGQGYDRPAGAHEGACSPGSTDTGHLHSLCSEAPANPQSCSALEALGGRGAGMATSSGRGRPGPGSSPSPALPCRRADCAVTLRVGCHPHPHSTLLLTKQRPLQHPGSWKFSR